MMGAYILVHPTPKYVLNEKAANLIGLQNIVIVAFVVGGSTHMSGCVIINASAARMYFRRNVGSLFAKQIAKAIIEENVLKK